MKPILRGGRSGRFGQKNLYFNKRKLFNDAAKERNLLLTACKNIVAENVKLFEDLPLSKKTLLGLKESGYSEPTEVQRESLCLSLQGFDVLGAAKTGSGKTLAFIIPILECLNLKQWVKADGVGALVITPTRELAFQIFETLKKVGHHHDFSAGLIIGGHNFDFEKNRMDRCNIIICTPGRLLQHMDENPLFTCDNLQILVLDEADRCLDMGFEQAMNCIIENLPVKRQTLLYSATQTKSVRDLARLSLKDPMYVSVHEHAKHSTPDELQQNYVVCELAEKINLLWSFIKNHRNQKIMVFLSSCKQVKYHYDMFCRLRPGVSLLALYGKLPHLRRVAIYEEFCRKKCAVLFATDLAARGLDFPEVNWVLQLDCPEDANTYIHRAGRTARYHRGGESLLVLLPSEEEAMMEQLKAKKIPINKIRVNPKKLQSPLKKMQSLLVQDVELKATAQRAFVSYLKAVYLMKNKSVFNIYALDTDAYSRSLGLAIPPKIRFLKKVLKSQQNTSEIRESDSVSKFSNAKNSEGDELNSEEEPVNDIIKPTLERAFCNKADSDSESGDDLLQIKRKDHDLDISQLPYPMEQQERISQKQIKIKTKAAVAKKLLKKKIIVNTKRVFDDEGNPIIDHTREKISALAKEYESEEVGGIDIEKAKLILREEDKFDKQIFREKVKAKHREIKRKLKNKNKTNSEESDNNEDEENESKDLEDEESEKDSGSEPDLSWLPDPDKVYGPKKHFSDDDEEEEEGGDKVDKRHFENSDSEEDILKPPERWKSGIKRKKQCKLLSNKSKRRNVLKSSDEQLDLMADEELALHFLKNR